MIAIQLVLILGFLLFFWRFLANPASHQVNAGIKIFALLFTLMAVVAILFPGILDRIAHSLGVKTGANLLLYFLTLAFLFVVVNLYTKRKEDQRRIVTLVRRVALLEAELKKIKKD